MKKLTLGKLEISGGSRSQLLFSISRRDVGLAVGYPLDSGAFLVVRGSHASSSPAPNFGSSACSTPRAIRRNLIDAGVLAASDGDGALRFTQDWLFNSSSTAASVVLASSANGNDEWLLV